MDTPSHQDFQEFVFSDAAESQVKKEKTCKLIKNLSAPHYSDQKKQYSLNLLTQNGNPQLLFAHPIKSLYGFDSVIPPLIKNTEGMKSFDLNREYSVSLKSVLKDSMTYDSAEFDDFGGEKVDIDLNDLFDSVGELEHASKILILGEAGVGKSTLMQYMAFQWSKNKLWENRFDMVYRVTLKSLLNSSWKHYYQTERAYRFDFEKEPLKYLIHYSLQVIAEKKKFNFNIKPEDIQLNNAERVALLVDGYDEIQHIQEEPIIKLIKEQMFSHSNLILTSRTNAASEMFKQKFNKIIEINGFDRLGVLNYIQQYFATEKEEIQQQKDDLVYLLDNNSILSSLCNVPVNLIMLCYIFTQKNDDISRISFYNSCQLYQQVIKKLGEKLIKLEMCNQEQESNDFQFDQENQQLEKKIKNIPELKVIRYLAYAGLTGGCGTESEEWNKRETQVIQVYRSNSTKGSAACIEEAIDYLNEQTTVANVLKFGLLRKEGINKKNTQYSFIHLSFQEYLTADYFVEKLKLGSDKEKSDILRYISMNRNEPHLLLTLKFMSGIITLTKNIRTEVLRDFWNSMCCNVDGVIELSLEQKIKLLMHLLGQSLTLKENSLGTTLDKRIPNLNDLIALINTVVVKNISQFKLQLRDSNFLSKNIIYIIEGLMLGKDCRMEVLEKIKFSYTAHDFSIFGQGLATKEKKPNLNQKMLELIEFHYHQSKFCKAFTAQLSFIQEKTQTLLGNNTSPNGNSHNTQQRLSLMLKGLTIASQIPKKVNWEIFEKSVVHILEQNENYSAQKNVLSLINSLFQTHSIQDTFQKQILSIIIQHERKYYDNLKKQIQQSQNNPKLVGLVQNIEIIKEDKECFICYQSNIPKSDHNSNSSIEGRPEKIIYETIIKTLHLIYENDPEIVLKWVNMMIDFSIHSQLSIIPKLFQIIIMICNHADSQGNELLKNQSVQLINHYLKSIFYHLPLINSNQFKLIMKQLNTESRLYFSKLIEQNLVGQLAKRKDIPEDLFENIAFSIQNIDDHSQEREKLIKEIASIYLLHIKIEASQENFIEQEELLQYDKYLTYQTELLNFIDNKEEGLQEFSRLIDFLILKLQENKENNFRNMHAINTVYKNSNKLQLNQSQFNLITTFILQCKYEDSSNRFLQESIEFIQCLANNKDNSHSAQFLDTLFKTIQGKNESKQQIIGKMSITKLIEDNIQIFNTLLKDIFSKPNESTRNIKLMNFVINCVLSQNNTQVQTSSFNVLIQAIQQQLKQSSSIKQLDKLFWNFIEQLKLYQINQQIIETLLLFLSYQEIHFEVAEKITQLFKDSEKYNINILPITQTILNVKIQLGVKQKDLSKDESYYSSFSWQLEQLHDISGKEEITKNVVNNCQKLIENIAMNNQMETQFIKEKLDILISCILIFQNRNEVDFQVEYSQLIEIAKLLLQITKNRPELFEELISYVLSLCQSVKEKKKKSVLSRESLFQINEMISLQSDHVQLFSANCLKVQRELILMILLDQKRSSIIQWHIQNLLQMLDKFQVEVQLHALFNIFYLFLKIEDPVIYSDLALTLVFYLHDQQLNCINGFSEISLDQRHPIDFRLEVANSFALVYNTILSAIPNSPTIFHDKQDDSTKVNPKKLTITGQDYSGRNQTLQKDRVLSGRDRVISSGLETNLSNSNMIRVNYNIVPQLQRDITSSNKATLYNIEQILLSILQQHKEDIHTFMNTKNACLTQIVSQIDMQTSCQQVEQTIKDIIDSAFKIRNYLTLTNKIDEKICALLNGISDIEVKYQVIVSTLTHIISLIDYNNEKEMIKNLHILSLSIFGLFEKASKLTSDISLKFIHCIINKGDIHAYENVLSQKLFLKVLILIEERDEKQIIEQLLLKFKIKAEQMYNYLQSGRYHIVKKFIQFQEDDFMKYNLITQLLQVESCKQPFDQIVLAKLQMVNMTIVHKSIKNPQKFIELVFKRDEFSENGAIQSINWYTEQFKHLNKLYSLLNVITKFKSKEITQNKLIQKFNAMNIEYKSNYLMLVYENLHQQVKENHTRIIEDIRSYAKAKFGFSYYKIIFLALNIISNENDEISQKKELIGEGKQLIRNILNDLEEAGEHYIIRNISRIIQLSYFSKVVFQKVIEILIKDNKLFKSIHYRKGYNSYSAIAEIINSGANIQIYKNGIITIDNHKYQGNLNEEGILYLNREVSKMIRLHKNPFITQYYTYQPILLNTSPHLISSVDQQEYSIVDSSYNYQINLQEMNINSIWKLVELSSYNGEKIVFFEKRNIFGRRMVCKIDFDSGVPQVVQIYNDNLMKIFGEYRGPKMFYCSVYKNPLQYLKQDDVIDIQLRLCDWNTIDTEEAFLEQYKHFQILKKYYTNIGVYEVYHDALLQMVVTANRIQDIQSFAFIKIIKQYENYLKSELATLYPDNKKIQLSQFVDYFHGFVKTFVLCFTESQILVSDKYTYEKGSGVKLSVVYQIISILGLIEEPGNTIVQTVQDFIEQRNIKKLAQAFLQFAGDYQEVCEKSCKLAILIIKKMKEILLECSGYVENFLQNSILQNVSRPEQQNLPSRSSIASSKVKSNFKKVLGQIQSLQQFSEHQILSHVYSGKYELLGNNDAQQLIQIMIKSNLKIDQKYTDDLEQIKEDIDYQESDIFLFSGSSHQITRTKLSRQQKKQTTNKNCNCSIF